MSVVTPELPLSPSPPVRQSRRRSLPEHTLPLGEQLVRAGVLKANELEAALNQHSNKRAQLGEVLLELGFVQEDTLLQFLGQQVQIPTVRLREGLVDPAVVRLLPRSKAEALCAIAMFKVRGVLSVAMAEPRNLQQVDELERITGLVVKPVLGLRSTLEKMVPRCYEDNFSVDAVTADLDQDAVEVQAEAIDIELGDIESLAEGSPVINLVNYVIVNALRQKASDIHVEPGHRSSIIRYRVDGQLREVLRPRREFHPAIVSRLKVMAKLDISEHRMPQDGRIHVVVEGHEIDLRISTLPTITGEKVVMRVLDKRNVTFNLDQLGVPAPGLKKMKEMLGRPHGLLLVTGPTGSGKTTTLYSAVELIKSVSRNIVTVEDPVEYQLEQINQVQVGATKAMNFSGALRSILRQDPDVIMVGEIRDSETAAVAIQAALTGHLVLSTLHTNDAASAVTRLNDMGVEKFKTAAALLGVVAQRLVRMICPKCRTPHYPPAGTLELLRYQNDQRHQFFRGEGCRDCYDTGFRSRVGIYEVLWASREMKQVIVSSDDVEQVRACHLSQGGTTLMQEGIRMAEEGKTSLDEVIRVAFSE